ncbi:FAD-binding oxidoreductase [Flavobacterium subsaxonicum]|uniref:FAD-binding protein n=1 Tax=Flavobacterium subsaxonicum WB 4.1-42 = DSM 21790 TaxID=1121898 RepID=A0A0A2MRF4_9FLAO|nr:FAD-dependent oxidoreductase [Flavobacterium subsaxonicum]KGO94929.1 FAD-binding protein [Flavobacterium subsaxonicum WB 4.1-42 = DSM 21790]
MHKSYILIVMLALFCFGPAIAQDSLNIVNDVTQLNPITVSQIIAPTTTKQIVSAVKTHDGPISIGGGRYSMGGQTATERALHIDMRSFDSIVHFSETDKEITVQAGITWRKIQEFIDPYNLSVSIMQSYANFTVGGSLSVNVHGRYIGKGPVILSVKKIEVVLANGTIVTATPLQNKEVFYGAIGGYGGLGVITEVTLQLADNVKVERTDKLLAIKDYKEYFFDNIKNDSTVIFHNANIYPNNYNKVREVSYRQTSKEVTITDRLKPLDEKYNVNKYAFKVISASSFGKWMRQYLLDPALYAGNPVEWRNYEASYDVLELEPESRIKSTYVLQEYFVPVGQFDSFYPLMATILKNNNVNVINISIRHANKDPGSLLAWAKTEVFAFVLYYKQGTEQKDKDAVAKWTQQLIDASISCGGTYYLPYQLHATQVQFAQAYPDSPLFFELKKKLDPTNKFTNKLWDKYYP